MCVFKRERESGNDPFQRSLLQKNQFHLEHSGNLGECIQDYKNICLDLFVGYNSRALGIMLRQKTLVMQILKKNLLSVLIFYE